MFDEIALVFIGMLIGALVYFVIGWVTLERTVQELTLEARKMRGENEELRSLLQDLTRLVKSAPDARRQDAVALAGPRATAPVDESVCSFAVESELSGRTRPRALADLGYFRGG